MCDLSGFVRQFFRAPRVTAVARQLGGIAGIVAVLAAILVVLRRHAVARRMSAPFGFGHGFS